MPRLATAEKEEIQSKTRKKILEAATIEFANHGFTGANINQISLAAGFAKGTIYNYFPTKRDLILALIGEIGSNHTSFIIERVQRQDDPAQRMKQFFDAGFHFVGEFPAQAQVAISAVYGFDPEFKAHIYQAYQGLFNLLIEDIMGFGIECGCFKSNDADSSAALLMSIYLGSSSLYNPDGGVWFDPEKVTAFVMDGIRQRDSSPEIEG